MGHFKSNLRDIEFNLFEMLHRQDVLGSEPYGEVDEDTVRGILDEVNRLATGPVAESLRRGRPSPAGLRPRHPLGADPRGVPEVVPGLHGRRVVPPRPAPRARRHQRPALGRLGRGRADPRRQPGRLDVRRCRRVLPRAVAARHAGAAARRRARGGRAGGATPWCSPSPTPARTWARAGPGPSSSRTAPGTSRASSASSPALSMTCPDNILHLVLARPQGAGPGTKGLSMFLVPKYQVGADGELGERNGVYVTGVEHKMGLKVSTTCEVTFGAEHPAVGTLVGGVHDGIRQMFLIIESARMMVGTKAISTLSTGYLNALDFARSRVQGADLRHLQ